MDPDSEESIGNSVRRVLDLIDASSDLQGKKKAMIKPNICCDKDWTTGTTTCPWVVRTVVQWLKENGIHDITLADGTIVGQDTLENMEKIGFMRLAEEFGLELVDLNKDKRIELKVDSPRVFEKIKVARTPLETDYLINIPVMKTHICTSVTLSMKNLKGLLDKKWKRQFHFMGLDGALADLASVVRPDLNIIDGTVGMEGRGPINGTAKEAGVLLASRDHFAADIAGSRVMGLDPLEIRHLTMFAERIGIGVESYWPHLTGDVDFKLAFEKPVSARDQCFSGIELDWGDPCSGCANALGAALDHLERDGDIEEVQRRGGVLIALGKKADPDAEDNLFLMGRCQYRNRKKGVYIPGCPPQSFVIRGLFYEMIGKQTVYRQEDVLKEAEDAYGDELEDD
jgi:uncharacterized protein (DUF362 family)